MLGAIWARAHLLSTSIKRNEEKYKKGHCLASKKTQNKTKNSKWSEIV